MTTRTAWQTFRVWWIFITTDACDRPGMVRKPWSIAWLMEAWRDARVLGA